MQIRHVNIARGLLGCLLVSTLPANSSVIVQLKILDGDGATYRAGSKAARGLTVLVTDETGKPVENAAVSFRLPEEGSSGVFSSGLRTDVVTTGLDGHASVWGIQWNKIAGAVDVRVTAVKDQARAGVVSTVYLTDTVANFRTGGEGVFSASHKSRTKWIIIAAVAGGAAVGLTFGRYHSGAAVAPVSTGVFIGNPTIIVGHP